MIKKAVLFDKTETNNCPFFDKTETNTRFLLFFNHVSVLKSHFIVILLCQFQK